MPQTLTSRRQPLPVPIPLLIPLLIPHPAPR
jgi:hypothetical protein